MHHTESLSSGLAVGLVMRDCQAVCVDVHVSLCTVCVVCQLMTVCGVVIVCVYCVPVCTCVWRSLSAAFVLGFSRCL